jgi:hypothetical protein
MVNQMPVSDTNSSSDQTIQTISQIDKQIQSIYADLEALSVQQNPNVDKQNQMLQKIQELQQLKTSLYTSLSNNYTTAQSNIAVSRNSLVNELVVGDIVENELANAKNNLSVLQNARYNKLRMAEINTYYSDKYETQSKVMKTIVYFCVPILILGILMKQELIPQNIAMVIISVIIAIAIVVVTLQVIDIMRRDNMNFSEYNFPFDPTGVNIQNTGNDADQPKKAESTIPSCVGEACCPSGNTFGTVWDATNKQCVTPTFMDSQSQSEGFVGERCLQNSFGKCDFNVKIFKDNNSIVDGYSENSSNYAKF